MDEIRRGDIYFADLCPVVGSEQGGVRPVLIIQNNTGNHYSPTVIAAAITGRKKKPMPTHVSVSAEGLSEESTVLLEQIRTIDRQRLLHYVNHLDKNAMRPVDKAISVSLGLESDSESLCCYCPVVAENQGSC